MLTWTLRLATFKIAWKKAIEEQQDKEGSNKLPILHRNFAIKKWFELYANYANQRIGARMCPLSYVLRDDVATFLCP